MRCEDFDELIHLLWDGRIDERKKEELEKHLSTCERCKEKLTLLESIEKGAKGIKTKEPSPEYWDTFSSRVRERIIAQKEESFSFKLKKVFESVFTFSPLKIKVAAGVVSIVLVFIVGKLYVDYRGKEIVPTKPRTENRKGPAFHAPEVTEEISIPEERAKREERLVPPSEELEKTLSPDITSKGEIAPVTRLEDKAKKKERPAPPAEELKRAQAAKDITQEGAVTETVESKEEILSKETYTTGSGAEEKGKVLEETVQPEHKAKDIAEVPLEEATKPAAKEPSIFALSNTMKTTSVTNYYLIDDEQVLRIGEEDTLLQEDLLRKTIESWTSYIEKNPEDSLANEGYLQVAIGYYLLSKLTRDESKGFHASSKLTRDESDLLKGIELLEKYEKQATNPKTKEELNKKLKQLKALKEK